MTAGSFVCSFFMRSLPAALFCILSLIGIKLIKRMVPAPEKAGEEE